MLRFAWAWMVVLIAGAAFGDENLLGLPTPRDPNRPGAVLLHGGGRITGDAFDRFWELAGGKEARIVLVPCAGFRPADYDSEEEFLEAVSSRYSSWVRLKSNGWIKSFQFLYTDDPSDADDGKFVKALASATGVWFSGGAQSRVNYRFVGNFPEQSRFQQELRGVIERGGVVGGTSAGMAALPEVITIRDDYDGAYSPVTAMAAHGLGLFDRAIVEQHVDGRIGRLERFTGLLRDNDKLDRLAGRAKAGEHMLGIAVEESTGLIAQGNRLQVVGNGSVHVFVKSSGGRCITWHELAAGDTAQLLRDVPNHVQLAREEIRIER